MNQNENTIEPQYFKVFRENLDNRFNKLEKKIEDKIEKEVGDLAIITANQFKKVDERFDKIESEMAIIKYDMVRKEDIKDMVVKDDIKDMATKDDINKINQLIGSYEVRAVNIEQILLNDHKPRIIDLEKEVFA